MKPKILLATLILASVWTSDAALAGGFEYYENGAPILGRAGAWGAKADDPFCIAYNPAGLTLLGGHQLYVGLGLTYVDSTYTRSFPALEDPDDPPYVTSGSDKGVYDSATVSNEAPPFFAPSLAWGYGSPDGKWGIGFGVYGPSAYGSRKYPDRGPQQFLVSETDILLAFVTLSAAWKPIPELSLGVSLQYGVMPVTKFVLTVDGNLADGVESVENQGDANVCDGDPPCQSPYYTKATLDVQDWTAFAAIVGVHWAPYPFLEFGLSSRVTPVYLSADGEQRLSFTPGSDLEGLFENETVKFVSAACRNESGGYDPARPGCREDKGVTLDLVLPPWLRFGVRYVQREGPGEGLDGDKLEKPSRELWDIELDVVAEFWSMLENFDVEFHGKLKFLSNVQDLPPFKLPKKYRDVVSVRLGGDVNAVQDLFTVHWGLHYESSASPAAYSHLDFASFDRVGIAAGFTFNIADVVDLSLAYQFIYALPRDVSVAEASVTKTRPLAAPPANDVGINAGSYETMYHTGNLSAVVRFQ